MSEVLASALMLGGRYSESVVALWGTFEVVDSPLRSVVESRGASRARRAERRAGGGARAALCILSLLALPP